MIQLKVADGKSAKVLSPSRVSPDFRSDPAAAMASRMTLRSSDGEVFEVDETVAMESQTIKHMIEDDFADSGIPLPNVNSKILSKVLEYCQKHVEAGAAASSKASDDISKKADEELKSWDAEFVKVDQATLFDLITAANYLNIKGLLDLTSQTVADMIKGKTTKEICKMLNIKNDFTPEEVEAVRQENRIMFNIENDFTPEEEEEAANYLNIKGLRRLRVRAVGDMIRGKSFNIQNAANYLNIKGLLRRTVRAVGDMIRGKTFKHPECRKLPEYKGSPSPNGPSCW